MADYLDADVVVPNDFYDIFDLPLEDIEPYSEKDDWNDLQFDIPMDMAMGFASGLGGALQTELPKETKNISTSHERTCRPNQCTIPDETTSSGGPLHSSDDSSDAKPTHLFKTSSPVSILESSNSCFSENPKSAPANNNNPNLAIAPAKRARTKRSRSRPSSFTKLCALPFIWETNPYASDGVCSAAFPAGRAYNNNYNKPAKRSFPKKKTSFSGEFSAATGEAKRCSHCEVTSTPQWREGPMGPKTLCNACGVRYRSGRLFPEYRPAASPTFVPSVHSNSHKKVVEMRNKTVEGSNSSTSSGSGGGGGNKAALKLYYRSSPSQSGSSVRQLIV